MDSRQPPGKNSRSHRVGNPAMIAGARQAKSHQGMGGITHAPNVQVQTGRLAWNKQIIAQFRAALVIRSEEHTSELQSLMRISYAVFCLKKKIKQQNKTRNM